MEVLPSGFISSGNLPTEIKYKILGALEEKRWILHPLKENTVDPEEYGKVSEALVQMKSNKLVSDIRKSKGCSFECANDEAAAANGPIERMVPRLILFNAKMLKLMDPRNPFQWEVWAKKTQRVDYYNFALPRLRGILLRSWFVTFRVPLGQVRILRAWYGEMYKKTRRYRGKDVTGFMMRFLMSDLGENYIQYRSRQRQTELHYWCISLFRALCLWRLNCVLARKGYRTKLIGRVVRLQKRNVFRLLRGRVNWLLCFCWWNVTRKISRALRNAARRVSLGHQRK